MIPADVDPSLCSGEPARESLDDGFSPPPHDTAPAQPQAAPAQPVEALLTSKSPF